METKEEILRAATSERLRAEAERYLANALTTARAMDRIMRQCFPSLYGEGKDGN